MVEVHAIVTVNTINVRYALLVLAPRLYAILYCHITQTIPLDLDVFGPVTLLDQALYQVALVCRLTTPKLLHIFLMIKLSKHIIFFSEG
jgi:hypothetical protein